MTMRAPASVSAADRGVERGPPHAVELGQLGGHRDDGLGRRREPDVGRPRPARRTGGHHAHRAVRQLEVAGEDRDAVIGFACGHDAVGADDPDGGFDADDALQACGHAPRSGGVGADRDVGLAGGDRDGRAGTGTAADEFGAAAVGHGAVGRPGADEAGRELVEIGLADDDGAGRAQCRHDGRVALGSVGELRAGGGGGQPGDVDVVLDRERAPRPAPRRCARFPPGRPRRRPRRGE